MMKKVAFAGLLVMAVLVGCATNPITGRSQLMLVSEGEVMNASEQAYVSQIAEQRKLGKLETNARILSRVRGIANRVIAQAVKIRPETARWNWQVNVIDEPEVNAYAMAGGKIAVYTGLLNQINPTDDELAQVLGHEIAHALAGHSREKMSIAMGTDLAIAAYGATQAASDNTQQALAAAALLAVRLPNSRLMESEADRIGIEIAAKAGYDPNAAVSLWTKMSRKQSGGVPQFLSTHPSDSTRINALSDLVPRMMPYYRAARNQ